MRGALGKHDSHTAHGLTRTLVIWTTKCYIIDIRWYRVTECPPQVLLGEQAKVTLRQRTD